MTSAATDAGPADRAIALVQLLVQIPFPLLGIGFAQLSTLDDSYCSLRPGDGYRDCGDPAWPDRAETLSTVGGIVLFLATLAWICWAAHQRRRSATVAACLLGAQAILLVISGALALQFGPG